MSLPFDALVARWSEWIVTASLQAGVAALVVLAADVVLRRFAWPRLRLALHALVVVKLFVPPGLGGGFGVPGVAALAPFTPSTPLTRGGLDATAQPAPAAWLPVAAFAAWLVVALALLVGGVVRDRRARRRVRAQGVPAPRSVQLLARSLAGSLGLRLPPEVVVSAAVATPIVFGGRGGFVALPRDGQAGRSDDDLVHVLLHELAHVRRRDALAAALVWFAASLFWFHPLVWLVARRMAGLRELCCDATVAAHLRGDARRLHGYRSTLLRAAAKAVDGPEPASALGFGSPSSLIARLEWLARPRRLRPRLELAGTALVVALAGAFALPTASGDRPPDRVGGSAAWTGEAGAVAGGDDVALARARATVESALAGRRPPGCLNLQYSVLALAAQSERTAPRTP